MTMLTNIVLCGCVSTYTPPNIYPSGRSFECLSVAPSETYYNTSLGKRAIVLSLATIEQYSFSCNLADDGNPYQNCLNAMGAFCNIWYMGSNITRIDNCKKVVDKVSSGANSYWKDYRRACGQWSFQNAPVSGLYSSDCTSAKESLTKNAFYFSNWLGQLYVTTEFLDSLNPLWSLSYLK